MSLLCWMPLLSNDSVPRNQGLDDVTFANTTTPVYYAAGNSNLGVYCLNLSTSTIDMTIPALANCTTFSVSFWLYPETTNTVTTDTAFCKLTTVDGSSLYQLIFSGIWGGSSPSYCTITDANSQIMGTSPVALSSAQLPAGEWTHVTLTADGTNVRLYYGNGNVHTYSQNGKALQGKVVLGSGQYTGRMTDFRIYDHALSNKEVSELSRGLMAHYLLNDVYSTIHENKYSGEAAKGDDNIITEFGVKFTKTRMSTDEDGVYYNYKFNYTGTGSNTWAGVQFPQITSFTPEKRHYYSCKIRFNSMTGTSLHLSPSRYINDVHIRHPENHADYVEGSSGMATIDTTLVGKWVEYTTYCTVPETVVHHNTGQTIQATPMLELVTSAMPDTGSLYAYDFDIKDVQVIESDEPLPYIHNDFRSMVVYDGSGFGHDGYVETATQPLFSMDSPVYRGSYKFTGTQYVKSTDDIWKYRTLNDITMAAWAKSSGGGIVCIGKDGSPINQAMFGLFKQVWEYSTPDNRYFIQNGGLTDTEWNHFVWTFKNGTYCIYRNGQLISSATEPTIVTTPDADTHLSIGMDMPGSDEWCIGNISDVRIFGRVLTAEEVLDLYQSKITIDDHGTLFCYEYVEDDVDNVTFDSRGVVTAAGLTINAGSNAKLYSNTMEVNGLIER